MSTRNVYRRLLNYLRPYRLQMTLAYGAMAVATLVNLLIPQVIQFALDWGMADGHAQALFVAATVILAIALVRGGAGFLQRYWGEWLTYRVSLDLRDDFFRTLQNLPFSFYDRAHTGDLMSRATGDTTETERFAGIGLLELTAVALLLSGIVVAMFLENVRLALLALPELALLVAVSLRFGRVVEPMFRSIQEQMGIVSTVMQESLTGINLVKAFAREPHEYAKFDKENDEWFRRRTLVIRTWGDYWPLFTLIIAAGVFVLLWVGGPMVLAGEITVGSLFALISYMLMLSAPAQQLGNLVNLAATAGASAQRVFAIVDTPSEIVEQPGALALDHVAGAVTFEEVSFAYHGSERVLHDVSFRVQPGQTVALVGPTGSGKSTVAALLSRFYDPTHGRVLVDGVDIRAVTLHSLRLHIASVLQVPFLFSTTIRENIAYGAPGAGEAEVVAAAQAARAHEFILRFPAGYETRVGERGVTLSGGQRQRIAIARALLTNPRILILDDSTSSVDTETEHLIQEALAALMANRTTFVIAQRLTTLKNADCILVMDGGRIAERGAHGELLARGGLYRQIYELQLKDQEEVAAAG